MQVLEQFFNTTVPNLNGLKIAVAVSGGADSMALCLGLNEISAAYNLSITALTVDHKLRPESGSEAEQVHNWLMDRNMHHEVLTWKHSGINSKIQEEARKARYSLLTNYCKQHSIEYLFLGHHLYDQFETFMMRLSHQSSLKGLTCMAPIKQRDGINLCRPFLNVCPEELKSYLREHSQPWLEDPSNKMEHYERIQWRKWSPELIELGISPEIIANVCEKLRLENDALDWSVDDWMQRNTIWHKTLKYIHFDAVNFRNLPSVLAKRIMIRMASKVRGIELTALDIRHNLTFPYQHLCTHPFKPFTFGGCYWMRFHKRIYVVREWDKCPESLSTKEDILYDHRFVLKDLPMHANIQPMRKKYWPFFKHQLDEPDIPYQVFLSFPICITKEELILPNSIFD
ncbi:MAG: tRNA lysidine(34) synthetase TilS [Candidatus Paracaedibacteraceae bacterium]|nr:tRNA lysidine(34) synthetase TilS [Candidatus Paracaedibacteraceae bacterium]